MSGLSHWQFRKLLVISANTDAGANYQLGPLTIYYGLGTDTTNNFYLNGRCNSDFSDLRFTDENGFLLSYWIQTKTDGVSATVWVKCTADLSDRATIIFLYYGNGSASSTSSQANTFIDVISGVVGAWNMEEALATDPVLDYSGNGNDGTPTGTTVVAGKFAGKNARGFAGAANRVEMDLPVTVAPYAVIMNLNITDPATNQVVYHLNWGGNYPRIIINGGKFLIYTGADFYAYSTPIVGAPTGWINVAFLINSAVDAGLWKVYINGLDATGIHSDGGVYVEPNIAGAFGANEYVGSAGNVFILSVPTETQIINISTNYPDVSLEAGKVLVRKYAYPAPTATSIKNEQPIYSKIAPIMRRNIIQ
jgi:hypothetical protein